MRNLLLLALISAVAKSTDAANCDACIQKQCYVKEVVYEGYIYSNLAVAFTTNELYFMTRVDDKLTKILYDLDTNSTRRLNIPDDLYLRESAFDQDTAELYLSSGAHLYMYKNHTLQDFDAISNATICGQLQYKSKLHCARIPRGLCQISGKEVMCYKELDNTTIDDFVLDKNNDIFYKSGSVIFKHLNPIPSPTNNTRFAKLAVDTHGELYYNVFDKIWKYNYDSGVFDEIGLVGGANIYRYTFDRDNNLIYFNIKKAKKIYRLLPSQGATCTIIDKDIIVDSPKNSH